ncbi:MAG: Gfo/Idh/MocA family oxidoreductase [Planctomycetota bacterium]
MRIGIIGAGAIGDKHALAAREAGVEVARIVDRDLSRAKLLAELHQAAAGDKADAIWSDDSIDAVVIGVPNCFHKPLAIEAMQAGKDVLLEKPMALNAAECDELISVASKTERVLQIGFVHRYTAVGQAAKEMVESGRLGEIYHAKAQLFMKRSVPGLGGWFTNKKMSGGGALIDIGVHLLDLSLHLMGQPTPVSVAGKAYSMFGRKMRDYVYESMWAGPPNYDGVCDVDDSAHAMITFESGASLDLHVCWAGNFPDGQLPGSMVGLFGDQGGLTFELFGDKLQLASEIGGRNADSAIALPACDQMVLQMQAFEEAVAKRATTTGASPTDGRNVQALVDAIYASSESNQPVVL